MLTQEQAGLLRKKIPVLEQALFFPLSESVLRVSASLVKALHVDELGQVWFTISRPTQQLSEFDREFPARLNFYKKGVDFYLHLRGQAGMILDPEELYHTLPLPEQRYPRLGENAVLVRFRTADYLYHASSSAAARSGEKENAYLPRHPLAILKTVQYIVKDVIPVFQSH